MCKQAAGREPNDRELLTKAYAAELAGNLIPVFAFSPYPKDGFWPDLFSLPGRWSRRGPDGVFA